MPAERPPDPRRKKRSWLLVDSPGSVLGASSAGEPSHRDLRHTIDRARRSYEEGEPAAAVAELRDVVPKDAPDLAATTRQGDGRMLRLLGSARVTLGLSYLDLDAASMASVEFRRGVECFEAAAAAAEPALAPHEAADYGIALEASGRPADAVALLRRAILGGADSPVAQRHLGRALLHGIDDAARRAEAQAALREAAEHLPNDPLTLAPLGALLASTANGNSNAEAAEMLARAGNAYGFRGRFADADAEFERALQIDPDHVEANLGRAEALRLLGRAADGLPLARRANDLVADDPRTHVVLSRLLMLNGEPADALAVAERGLKLDPQSRDLRLWTMMALDELGKADEAIGRLQAWLDDDPTWTVGLAMLGDQLRRDGDNVKAASVLARAIELDPRSALSIGTYGQVLLALGDTEGAEEQLRRALVLDGSLTWAVVDHARALVQLGRAREAIAPLERLFGEAPTEPLVAEVYARALIVAGRAEDAISWLLPLSEVDNPDPNLLTWLGEAYRVRGTDEDVRAGEAVLRRAIEIAPESAFAHGTLGALLAADGRFDAALEHLQVATDVDGSYAFAWKWRGLVLLDRERFPEAESALLRAVHLDPDDPAPWYWLGRARVQLNSELQAIEAFDEAHRLDREDIAPLIDKGQALRSLARDEEAVEAFDAALALDGDHVLALAEKGEALRVLGRFDQARDALQRALELAPDEPWVRASHAGALLGLQRYTEAIAELDDIVATSGEYYFALVKCGEAHSDVADYEGAWEVLRRADALDVGDDPFLQQLMGWAAFQRGEYVSACDHFESAFALERAVADHALAGDALLAAGRRDDATRMYHDGIALGREQEETLTAYDLAAVGWCFGGLGAYDEAARLLRSATEADDDPSLRCDLALALLGSGRAVLCLKEYERAFAQAAKGHPWRRYAILAVAYTELRTFLDAAPSSLEPGEARRVKRRVKEEVKAAEPRRYLPRTSSA